MKKYGEKGKNSAIKDIYSLPIKNSCFEEIEYEDMTEEMKKKVLLLLICKVMKRNGMIESRGVVNSSYQ